MRIAMEVSHLSHPRTGIGNYTRGSLAGLAEAAGGKHELVAFAPANFRRADAIREALAGIRVELRLAGLPFSHWWRTAWSRAGWPPAERFVGRFDVLHFWDWCYPPQRRGVRATSVNDVVPLRFPGLVSGRTRRMHGAKYRHAARTCDVVFANSKFTAGDVVERLGVPEERVRIAYPGVDPVFRADGERADLGGPYLLAVGTDPRKNLEALLRAPRPDGMALVVVGESPSPQADGVVPLGYVSDPELARLYRGAEALVYPSKFEGFGMPVVEAMASGIPAVASSHPSLDEAAGDVAVRIEPDDPESIAAGIERALRERHDLVGRGLDHARRFAWLETGRALLAGYEAALEQ